jgi:septal ring factor EnvC (AmiA/AmiB activator)
LGLVAALGLIMPATAPAGSPEGKAPRSQDSRDRLKEVQRELGREREKAKEVGRKEASLSRELTTLEEDLRTKTKFLRGLEEKLQGSAQRITKLARDISITEGRL